MIAEVDEPAFVRGRALRISIFMNVFNVHVNRYPVSGTVALRALQRRQVPQRGHRQVEPRERADVGRHRDRPRARARAADRGPHRAPDRELQPRSATRAEQGERMGIIRFGSRVDVFVPPGSSAAREAGRPHGRRRHGARGAARNDADTTGASAPGHAPRGRPAAERVHARQPVLRHVRHRRRVARAIQPGGTLRRARRRDATRSTGASPARRGPAAASARSWTRSSTRSLRRWRRR